MDAQNNTRTKPKKKTNWLKIALLVLAVLLVALVCGYLYLESLGGVGGAGRLSSDYYTAAELKGDVLNFLVCGIDFDFCRLDWLQL